MPGVARHRTLAVVACLGMALPGVGVSDTSSPQALVISLWQEFSAVCVPLISNPETARANFPPTDLGFAQYSSEDEALTLRQEGITGSVDRFRSIEISVGQAAAHISCEVARMEDTQPFSGDALAAAMELMVSQSAGLNLLGGKITLTGAAARHGNVEQNYGGSEEFRMYFIEGALGDRPDFIQVEIAEGLFGLYVAATILKEEWQ